MKNRKRMLNGILETAKELIEENKIEDVRQSPVYELIKILIRYRLYDHAKEICEDTWEKKERKEKDYLWTLFFQDMGRYLVKTDTKINEKLEVDLATDAVLVCAWKKDRVTSALRNIGKKIGNEFEYDEINHMAAYIFPIGVTVVYNGNHSALAGILKNEGQIYATQIYDLTKAYQYAYFDGKYFRRIEDKRVIQRVRWFELGAVFEIGRLLIENDNTSTLGDSEVLNYNPMKV